MLKLASLLGVFTTVQASTVVNYINSEGLSGKFGMIW